MTFYKVEDVQEKVNRYLGDKSFPVSPKFAKVENLRTSIEGAIKKGCYKNNLKYQNQFNQVIERFECCILSSKNWFNDSGMNFKSFRDCLNIKVEKASDFLENFELRYNLSGDKFEKNYDIKELVCIGQAKRYKGDFYEIPNWSFNPCLRFKKIVINDESDAYQDNVIDYNSFAKGAIIKGFDNGYFENTILMGIHYHSYSEEGNPKDKNYDYCPTLEKFELILLI